LPARPDLFAARPFCGANLRLRVDVLSEVLGAIKLKGAIYFNGEFTAPWGARTPASAVLARHFGPGNRVVIFHLLTEGRGEAGVEGGPMTPLYAGDIVVFPHGDAHVIGNGKPFVAVDFENELQRILQQGLHLTRSGGGGEPTRFICGYLSCDEHMGKLLLAGLPAMFKVNIREQGAGQWLEHAISHLVNESRASPSGGEAVLARLAESLFIETLRRHIVSLPPEQTGWLAGLRDPSTGRALMLLHADPGRRWTLPALAREAGMSRTVLAERFRQLIGVSPMAYLTRWRLLLAARLLQSGGRGVGAIAAEVGYESEPAFNRAFRREFGVPPARYRRTAQPAARAAQRK
jgi:AraC-like DNA-binding protein